MGNKKSRKPRALAAVHDGGNVFGADPHKKTLTATVLDERGGVLATETFRVSGDGHRATEAWALSFGPITRWGIEGASGLGRHTAIYLIGQGHDVRDVCPTRTAEQSRRRREGKTDALDSVRVARETQADTAMPTAFKRAGGDTGPDETHELLSLWHKARRSILKSRQHLLNEAENLLGELPEELRAALPDTAAVRPRLRVLADRVNRTWDPATKLRLRLLDGHRTTIAELDAQDKEAAKALKELAKQARSTLSEVCGIAERIEAELLVEVGDPRRFTGEGGFARFNGTAPLPASSAEGDGEPVRHRLNRGGNRRVNACLHRIAVTQLRCDPRARKIYDDSRRRGHTTKEAMRVLKRHLSDVVYRRMTRDLKARRAASQ
ncbi:MAG: transposase [Acidimicrobiia bacterium]|nr:transposase [Acidimicrobiia bacterium]